jgi:hypothetical protein
MPADEAFALISATQPGPSLRDIFRAAQLKHAQRSKREPKVFVPVFVIFFENTYYFNPSPGSGYSPSHKTSKPQLESIPQQPGRGE